MISGISRRGLIFAQDWSLFSNLADCRHSLFTDRGQQLRRGIAAAGAHRLPARSYFASAQKALAAGDSATAVEKLRQAVQADPKFAASLPPAGSHRIPPGRHRKGDRALPARPEVAAALLFRPLQPGAGISAGPQLRGRPGPAGAGRETESQPGRRCLRSRRRAS